MCKVSIRCENGGLLILSLLGRSHPAASDYWDGNRRYGYGGYKYDGRWKPLAQQFIVTDAATDSPNTTIFTATDPAGFA